MAIIYGIGYIWKKKIGETGPCFILVENGSHVSGLFSCEKATQSITEG